MGNPPDAQIANALPTASRRYGRLPICATWARRPRSGWAQAIPLVLGLLHVLRLTEPRSGPPGNSPLLTRECFFTKRTQFLQKTIRLELAANTNVAEFGLRKSVGFLYTKRTQFLGKGRRLKEKQKGTFNIQHSTPNIQHSTSNEKRESGSRGPPSLGSHGAAKR
jgi:hypothetical protein